MMVRTVLSELKDRLAPRRANVLAKVKRRISLQVPKNKIRRKIVIILAKIRIQSKLQFLLKCYKKSKKPLSRGVLCK